MALTALAHWDEPDAGRLADLLERRVADIDAAGSAHRGTQAVAVGIGIGMTMQNLVLAVQNTVAGSDLGAASSAVAFFRSLGGTVGVSVLGAVLSTHVGNLIREGLVRIPGAAEAAAGGGEVGLAGLADAPAPIQELIRASYGDATGRIFLVSAIVSVIAVVAILLIREVALSTDTGDERAAAERATGSRVDAAPAAEGAGAPVVDADADADAVQPAPAGERAAVG